MTLTPKPFSVLKHTLTVYLEYILDGETMFEDESTITYFPLSGGKLLFTHENIVKEMECTLQLEKVESLSNGRFIVASGVESITVPVYAEHPPSWVKVRIRSYSDGSSNATIWVPLHDCAPTDPEELSDERIRQLSEIGDWDSLPESVLVESVLANFHYIGLEIEGEKAMGNRLEVYNSFAEYELHEEFINAGGIIQ